MSVEPGRPSVIDPPAAAADIAHDPPSVSRRWPPPVVSVLVAVYVLVALTVRRFDLTGDNATTNIVIALMAVLGLVTVGAWYVLFSGFSRPARFAPPLLLAGGLAVFLACFRIDHVTGEMLPVFAPRWAPKTDERLDVPAPPTAAAHEEHAVDLRTTTPHDFPQFLGPERLCAVEDVAIRADWESHPPRLVWKQPIGAGWSGFAVVNGFAVTQEQRGADELVTCYRVGDGRVMWFHARPTRYESVMGGVGPRATPTIHDGRVYALGATGWLACLDGATGSVVWERHIPTEFGISPEQEEAIIPFARSNSPLIVDDLVIVPAGGPPDGPKVSLVAYHAETGDEVWRGGEQQLSHASPALAVLAGVRQVLVVNEDKVAGHDPASGRELWRFGWSGNNPVRASNSQPVPVPRDKVFVSKGQAGGAKLVRLVPAGEGRFSTETLWHNRGVLRTKFTNVTLFEGHAYGLSDGILECVNLDTGQRVWKAGRYQHGQLLRVGRRLVVLSENGEVVLIEATPEQANHVLGRFPALEGKTWNTFAFAPPHLLVRNAEQAACYELPLE